MRARKGKHYRKQCEEVQSEGKASKGGGERIKWEECKRGLSEKRKTGETSLGRRRGRGEEDERRSGRRKGRTRRRRGRRMLRVRIQTKK